LLVCAVAVVQLAAATARASAIAEATTDAKKSAISVSGASGDAELLGGPTGETTTWTNRYSISGIGTGATWGWQIVDRSTTAVVATASVLAPPRSGSSALLVANAFAGSIRGAIPNSVVTVVLDNAPPPGDATVTMFVQPGTQFATGFILKVGTTTTPGQCTVGSCPFNPTITLLGESAATGPALSTGATAALVATLLGLVSLVLWRRLRG
jgi:hypothetical protein